MIFLLRARVKSWIIVLLLGVGCARPVVPPPEIGVKPENPLELLKYYQTCLETTQDSLTRLQIQRKLYDFYFEQREFEAAYEVSQMLPEADSLFGMPLVLISLSRYDEVLKREKMPQLSKAYAAEQLGYYEDAIRYYELSPKVVSDYRELGMARCAFQLGDFRKCEEILFELPVRPEVQELIVRSLAAQKRWEELRQYLRELPKSTKKLSWLISWASELGIDQDDCKWELVKRYPDSPEAGKVVPGLKPSRPEDYYWLARAYEPVNSERAIEYYQEFLTQRPAQKLSEDVRYRLGRLWFREKKYEQADSILELCTTAQSRYLWAQVADRARAPEETRDRFWEFVERFPESKRAADALMMVGLSYEAEAKFDSASTVYQYLAQKFPESGAYARHRAGTLRLIEEAPEATIKILEGLNTPEAYYLRVKAAQALGDSARADALISELTNRYPYNYWALQLLNSLPVVETEPEKWFADTVIELAPEDSISLERAHCFLEAGLLNEARSELSRLKISNLYLFYRRSKLCARYGLDAQSIGYAERIRRSVENQILPRFLLELLYPIRYIPTIGEQELAPALILALIRQESWFEPKARSQAGAKGLMQLMPKTAQALSGDPLKIDQPEINIRLGSEYLSQMEGRFGSRALALTAYNAGPGNLSRWLERYPVRGDEFILLIPFGETSRYVPATLAGYLIYQQLLR